MDFPVDPTFPCLHGRPRHGWVNDPNGCSRVDGTWHVFYQWNADAVDPEPKSWGHMSSTDLAHWRTEPVALAPQPDGPDRAGCWSGCLVDDDGVPTLVYTAIASTSADSATVLARSNRALTSFSRDEPPVVGSPADPTITDVRDPCVFRFDGHRYAVQGAGAAGGVGRLLLYGCDDLSRWTELGSMLRADDPAVASDVRADIWECPNLFAIGEDWVLLVSLLSFVDVRVTLNSVRWLIGSIESDGAGLTFRPRSSGRLDQGPAFYAPQVTVVDESDGSRRAVLWGWSWELDRTPEQIGAADWQGVLTFARELAVDHDQLVVRPVPELEQLRQERIGPDHLVGAFEVIMDRPGAVVLELDGRPCWHEPLLVDRVFVDGSLVEVFTHDGGTWTTRAYPTVTSTWRLAGDLDDARIFGLG